MFTTKKTGIFATLLLALGLMLGVTVTGCTDEDRDRPDAPAAADVTAYVLPEGYVVGEDEEGNSAILNADGEVVPAAELPAECDINPLIVHDEGKGCSVADSRVMLKRK